LLLAILFHQVFLNVKQGGKYLVFLPLIENLEDEDGNIIGRKKGKERIAEYEKQIMEYFKDSDIKPSFHSMLGEYGDKENLQGVHYRVVQPKDKEERPQPACASTGGGRLRSGRKLRKRAAFRYHQLF